MGPAVAGAAARGERDGRRYPGGALPRHGAGAAAGGGGGGLRLRGGDAAGRRRGDGRGQPLGRGRPGLRSGAVVPVVPAGAGGAGGGALARPPAHRDGLLPDRVGPLRTPVVAPGDGAARGLVRRGGARARRVALARDHTPRPAEPAGARRRAGRQRRGRRRAGRGGAGLPGARPARRAQPGFAAGAGHLRDAPGPSRAGLQRPGRRRRQRLVAARQRVAPALARRPPGVSASLALTAPRTHRAPPPRR